MMGFNKVYNSLQELFPHIDARLLKAVAIEHSKDPDEAVSVVLEEIIPFITGTSKPSSPLARSDSTGEPSEVVSASEQAHVDGQPTQAESSSKLQKEDIVKHQNQQDIAEDGLEAFYDSYDAVHGADNFIESLISDKISEKIAHESVNDEHALPMEKNEVNALDATVSEEPEMEQAHLANKCTESSIKLSFDATPFERLQGVEKSSSNADDFFNGDVPSASHALVMSPLESSTQWVVEAPVMEDSNIENSEIIVSVDAANGENLSPEIGIEDSASDSNIFQPSSQMNIVEMIENMIADARNNKNIMFSAMEAVISLMKEVELKEKEAEQAKEEAASGGTDILAEVEEFKTRNQHAKDANEKLSGEVYGEKAILFTELKELQARIFWLADQRDKSLAILNEMHQALEVRISVAEDEMKSAELEKLEKEKDHQTLLAEHELIMEKIVQESNILKKQAEENAKLEKFLQERGSVIDTLQGEIAVICEDVNLLKEKFDERIPFSKSLTSSQTSCILASSSRSSSRNLILEEQTMADSLANQEKNDPFSAPDEAKEGILDEDWEIFDGPNKFP